MKRDFSIKICQVVSVSDFADGERIKVKLSPEDDRKDVSELPYAHPILPKLMRIKPQVGEGVLVFLSEIGNGYSNRFYIGPIISQPQFMEKDLYGANSLSLFNGAIKAPDEAISMNPDATGAFAKDNDIAIYGRKKNDIILSENDVKIRCGSRSKSGDKIIFNRTDPSYVLLRHTDDKKEYIGTDTNKTESYRSSATIVADKINLISNKTSPFTTNNKDNLITDEEMEKILKEAHQLPYGDLLVNFLRKFVNVFATHTHPYPGKTPCTPSDFNEVVKYDLDKILSNDIRIN